MQETSPLAQIDLLYRTHEEIRAIQNQRFRHQIALCFRAHPYYQEMFRRLKLTPEDFQTIEDVQKLPVTTKHDYLSNPEAFRLTALPEFRLDERILWDMNYTSGTTTGIPAPLFNTTHDYLACLEQFKRLAGIIGMTAQDRVVDLYPLTPFPHLTTRFPYGVMAIGASVIGPLTDTSDPNSPQLRGLDEAVGIIERHKGTVLCGIGSYVRRLLTRAEELGADFSRVRLVVVAGESCPSGTREEMRRCLLRLGANQHDLAIKSGLGFTEMQGSTGECVEFGGSHHPAPDQVYFEVLDEQSHTPLPDGEPGLFTITHLDRRGTVLLRYAIGDLTAISHETCPHCRRQGPRIVSNTIRTLERIKLKDTVINPDIIKEVLATVEGIQEYQVVFTKEQEGNPLSPDMLLVRVAVESGEQERVKAALMTLVAEAVQMPASVEFVDSMSDIFDPNQTLKPNRVLDLRPGEV